MWYTAQTAPKQFVITPLTGPHMMSGWVRMLPPPRDFQPSAGDRQTVSWPHALFQAANQLELVLNLASNSGDGRPLLEPVPDLAMMEHACVAKVFDAGTTETGRPYFVMEYVKAAFVEIQRIIREEEPPKPSLGTCSGHTGDGRFR